MTFSTNLRSLNFFFRALESIFISVVSALEAEMVFIRNLVGGLLAELEDDINHDKFKRLLHYSRRLTSFQNRVKLVRTFATPFPAPPDPGRH
jgi:magnesium transporter